MSEYIPHAAVISKEESASSALAVSAPQQFMQIIQTATTNGQKPDELKALFDLYREAVQFDAKQQFNRDFAEMKASIPPIPKTKKGPFGWFAPLDEIERVCKPHLAKYGFSYYWQNAMTEKETITTCILGHKAGHERPSSFRAAIEKRYTDEQGKAKGANDMQRGAAAQSYGNRRSLIDVLGLSSCDEDTDGQVDDSDHERADSIKSADGQDLFPFGKHKGVPWAMLDVGFLQWVIDEITNKPEVVARAKRELTARKQEIKQDAPAHIDDEHTSQAQMKLPDLIRAISKVDSISNLENLYRSCPDGQKPKIQGLCAQRKQEILNKQKEIIENEVRSR